MLKYDFFEFFFGRFAVANLPMNYLTVAAYEVHSWIT